MSSFAPETAPGQCSCGCQEVHQALEDEIRSRELNVRVAAMKVGCNGTCPYGPLVGFPGGGFYYHRLTPARARETVSETIEQGHILFRMVHGRTVSTVSKYAHCHVIAIRNPAKQFTLPGSMY